MGDFFESRITVHYSLCGLNWNRWYAAGTLDDSLPKIFDPFAGCQPKRTQYQGNLSACFIELRGYFRHCLFYFIGAWRDACQRICPRRYQARQCSFFSRWSACDNRPWRHCFRRWSHQRVHYRILSRIWQRAQLLSVTITCPIWLLQQIRFGLSSHSHLWNDPWTKRKTS